MRASETLPKVTPAPWTAEATTATDCTFHQLAPYIGRMKTSIARHLVTTLTRPGQTVVDPFCGSGVVPLEARISGRHVHAGDINDYGVLLTRAKLQAPTEYWRVDKRLQQRWEDSRSRLRQQDLRRVPAWVRSFFHPETLRDTLALRDELVAKRDWMLLSCLLGILHHQRPGFLSFPSSHLVPYLRDRLFPRDEFPEQYARRDVLTRMQAKLRRAYRRPPEDHGTCGRVALSDARRLRLPTEIDAVITSPPYMNELDYVRDNRLRLWLLGRKLPDHRDIPRRGRADHFQRLMTSTFERISPKIRAKGVIALVIGDVSRGGRRLDASQVCRDIFSDSNGLRSFRLTQHIEDAIPDIRRSRRDLRGTKRESILVYRKV